MNMIHVKRSLHLSDHCTLRAYYVPGIVLATENVKMDITFLFSDLLNLKCFLCTCGLNLSDLTN